MWSQLGEHCPCDQMPCAWWVYSWRPAGAPICSLWTSRDTHLNEPIQTVQIHNFRREELILWGLFLMSHLFFTGYRAETFSNVYSKMMPTCPKLAVSACVHGGRLKRLWHWALTRISQKRVRNSGLAFRVVDKHKAILLVNAERVWPAVRVVRTAVHWPRGTRSGWRTL